MSTHPSIEVHRARHPLPLYIGLGLLAVWILGPLALYLSDPESPPPAILSGPFSSGISAFIGAFLGVALRPYFMRRLLTYDPRTRSVEARDHWAGRWRQYPRNGFERLEIDAETGKLFQVRADGKRRKVPVSRGDAVSKERRAFIDQFERDHAPAEPDSS